MGERLVARFTIQAVSHAVTAAAVGFRAHPLLAVFPRAFAVAENSFSIIIPNTQDKMKGRRIGCGYRKLGILRPDLHIECNGFRRGIA